MENDTNPDTGKATDIGMNTNSTVSSTSRKTKTAKQKPAAAAKKTAAARKTAKTPIENSIPKNTVAKMKSAAHENKDFKSQARDKAGDAKHKAGNYANDAKARTGEAFRSLGKVIADTASVIDDNLGERYGNYARTASGKVSDFGDTIERKDFGELGSDTRDFVKKSPGVAIGIAAVAGFMLTRMFRSGSDKS